MYDDMKANTTSIQLMREYIVFARTLNFSAAAERLNISQPTLSNHMKRLEDNLGVALIEHQLHPDLTPAGREFVRHAESLVQHFNEAVDATRARAEAVNTLAIEDPINTKFLPEATTRAFLFFEREHPYAQLRLRSTSGKSFMEALEQDIVDIAKMVTLEPEGSDEVDRLCEERGIDAIQITCERPAVWLPRHHPLAFKDAISVKDLAGVPLLIPSDVRYDGWNRLIERWFEQHNVHPKFLTVVTGEIEEYFMANMDDKALLLPELLPLGGNLLAARGIVSRPIADEDCCYYVHLASLKSNHNQLIPLYKHVIAKQIEMLSAGL